MPRFPEGISGEELLDRLRAHAEHCDVKVQAGEVTELKHAGNSFEGKISNTASHHNGGSAVRATTILLATGTDDSRLDIVDWKMCIKNQLIRLCPICDAYEVKDQNIALLSASPREGVNHALFLRTYSESVTLIYQAKAVLTNAKKRKLRNVKINVIEDARGSIHITEQTKPSISLSTGEELHFDVIYPVLGESPDQNLPHSLARDATSKGN